MNTVDCEKSDSLGAVDHGAAIREGLEREAERLGFVKLRVARAGKAEHATEFRQWLADGCHAEMGYLENNADRRCNPELVVPGARSMIVLAMNYFDGVDDSSDPWRIVRYARGEDYHVGMEKKLKSLRGWLSQQGGDQRCYVDTGPVLERDWATSAGLGWSGKSTVQIHPELGTWFFLAVIITTLELPVDAPSPNRCGTCSRCLDACPTGAITAHRLDARKCLSYWSIEQRGPIPIEYRRPMGNRLYGCEECLTVCPWNRFAKISQEAGVRGREETQGMATRDFLGLDEAGFRKLFQKSPVKRLKLRAFLRNVCVVLGNIGTVEDVPALRQVVEKECALVSEHALWAIAEIAQRAEEKIYSELNVPSQGDVV